MSESEKVSFQESMKNRYEGFPEERGLIDNCAEFENDARLNREPVKRFQMKQERHVRNTCFLKLKSPSNVTPRLRTVSGVML